MKAFEAVDKFLSENIHPVAPWALLTVLVWAGVYATRRFLPGVWARLEQGPFARLLQGLPAVLMGALAGVWLHGGGFGDAWKGALSGALAPVLHHILKASPIPYTGQRGITADDIAKGE